MNDEEGVLLRVIVIHVRGTSPEVVQSTYISILPLLLSPPLPFDHEIYFGIAAEVQPVDDRSNFGATRNLHVSPTLLSLWTGVCNTAGVVPELLIYLYILHIAIRCFLFGLLFAVYVYNESTIAGRREKNNSSS